MNTDTQTSPQSHCLEPSARASRDKQFVLQSSAPKSDKKKSHHTDDCALFALNSPWIGRLRSVDDCLTLKTSFDVIYKPVADAKIAFMHIQASRLGNSCVYHFHQTFVSLRNAHEH
jgi:hypothetical protein